ncbi:MAG: hypothetical protein IMY73_00260 [Bacteroidetes bacterium]|nr:hypothetical protein [Bacteroidota bacterium]
MRKFVLLLAFSIFLISNQNIYANETEKQEDQKVSFKFDTRFDGQYTSLKGSENEGGFSGAYLNLLLSGKINDKFSYDMRYRMYKGPNSNQNYFNQVDWAYIRYNIDNRFFISGGKEIVYIGGFEYDYAPIDVYFASNFWNACNPQQMGFSLGYTSLNKKHTLKLQLTNSPFSIDKYNNTYAVNAIWYGDLDWFKTIYSVNMMEYQKGDWVNYIALGNQFLFNDFIIDFDYMNRAGSTEKFFADFSIISQLKYNINDKVTVFVKGGYDLNKAQDFKTVSDENLNTTNDYAYDKWVRPGTENGFWGAGVEYYLLKNKDLRIHAVYTSNNGDPIPQTINFGIKWKMKIIDRK